MWAIPTCAASGWASSPSFPIISVVGRDIGDETGVVLDLFKNKWDYMKRALEA